LIKSIEQLNNVFKYRPEQKDSWTVLTEQNPYGDCDDYAITAMFILAKNSWFRMLVNVLTLQTVMWMVKTQQGEWHMALWVRGKGWICNIYPSFGPCKHNKKFPYILPLFLVALAVK
jgi:predicted transglutaminase-like cysteine proteinase